MRSSQACDERWEEGALNCLSIGVTEQCPLCCAHCAPQSGPSKSRVVETELVQQALAEVREHGCKVVNYSGGGEPFAAKAVLTQLVACATHLGMVTRVTTSGVWATDARTAFDELGPLRDAGLEQVVLSCSKDHQAVVPLERVVHAASSARQLGILPFIYLLRSASSTLTEDVLKNEFARLSVPIPHVFTAETLPFGRAATASVSVSDATQVREELLRPCRSIGRNPMVHSNGAVTACSSVFSAECATLKVGDLTCDAMEEVLLRIGSHRLVRILAHAGPFAVAERLGRVTQETLGTFVNQCHLCSHVLADPRLGTLTESAELWC